MNHPGTSPDCAVQVRRCVAVDDAERIALLSGQLGYPASTEQVRDRLTDVSKELRRTVCVAVAPNRSVIGWIGVFVRSGPTSDPYVEVDGLVVDEAWRGKGVGRLLLQRAEAWAAEQGCQAVRIRVNVTRDEAHAFYASNGYNEIKTQRIFARKL